METLIQKLLAIAKTERTRTIDLGDYARVRRHGRRSRGDRSITDAGCHYAGRFAGRCQNRVQERPPDTVGESGGATGDNLGAALGEPIAFATASQIISREKGFSRKLDILSFCALKATAAGS